MKLSDLQCKDKSNDSGTSEIRTCTEISMLRKTGNFVVVFFKGDTTIDNSLRNI